jgi:hypothetical protein
MVTKSTVLRQLKTTSNEIAQKFDEIHHSDLDVIAQELAISYDTILNAINDQENKLSDNDFQSALLYWSALNSILSAIDLLRRGYLKEPQMLVRNSLEVFAVAYDFHANPERYDSFIANPKKFESTRSISEIKKVHSIIGQWYGMLSKSFTHVSHLHILPHKNTEGLCVGGILEVHDQSMVKIEIMATLGTLDVLSSVLELTFVSRIATPRYWKQTEPGAYKYVPNKERMAHVMNEIKQTLDSIKE